MRADPGADHHRQATDLPIDRLDLAGVHADADVDPERRHRRYDRRRAPDRARWPVERGEEPVPRRVDLHAAVPGELTPDASVVLLDQLLPVAIAELRGLLGGPDHVGEQHGRQCPVELGLHLAERDHEPLHLVDDRVGRADPREVHLPGARPTVRR